MSEPRFEDERFNRPDLFWSELMKLHKLHQAKSEDYGTDDDEFANVAASAAWGMPAWVGAAVRMDDKMFRLRTFAKRGTLRHEGVADTFQDLASYAVIGKILWQRDQK